MECSGGRVGRACRFQKVVEVKSGRARFICNSRQDEDEGCCGGSLSAAELESGRQQQHKKEEGKGGLAPLPARGRSSLRAAGLLIRQVKISQETEFPRKTS